MNIGIPSANKKKWAEHGDARLQSQYRESRQEDLRACWSVAYPSLQALTAMGTCTHVCLHERALTPQVHKDTHVHTHKYTQNIDI